MAAIRQVVLPRLRNRSLVVFVDGVESVRTLPFSTDELFAGIRQWCNARHGDTDMNRVTFCLSGSATPESLVKDPRTTPFNVGRRVRLPDFTGAEVAFVAEARGHGRDVARRIHDWTGGHPGLTHPLFGSLVHSPATSHPGDVDRAASARFIPGVPDADPHTAKVAQRILREPDAEALLARYADVLTVPRNRAVEDSPGDPHCAALVMSGLVGSTGGYLRPRNRIYERVFDADWVKAHSPAFPARRRLWTGWPSIAKVTGKSATLWSR
jgi:hypothetical protein